MIFVIIFNKLLLRDRQRKGAGGNRHPSTHMPVEDYWHLLRRAGGEILGGNLKPKRE